MALSSENWIIKFSLGISVRSATHAKQLQSELFHLFMMQSHVDKPHTKDNITEKWCVKVDMNTSHPIETETKINGDGVLWLHLWNNVFVYLFLYVEQDKRSIV